MLHHSLPSMVQVHKCGTDPRPTNGTGGVFTGSDGPVSDGVPCRSTAAVGKCAEQCSGAGGRCRVQLQLGQCLTAVHPAGALQYLWGSLLLQLAKGHHILRKPVALVKLVSPVKSVVPVDPAGRTCAKFCASSIFSMIPTSYFGLPSSVSYKDIGWKPMWLQRYAM